MHRTQILLEPEQYRSLRELAAKKGKSISQIIREFVDNGLAEERPTSGDRRKKLRKLKGFIKKVDITGRDHDRALYGGD